MRTIVKQIFYPFIQSYDLHAPSLVPSPKLGRWSINYDPQIIHRKIDQANEDHCGCCINEFMYETDEVDDKYEKELLPYCL